MFQTNIPFNNLPKLPGNFDYDQKHLLKLVNQANIALSKLNGRTLLIPNVELLLAPLLIKESVESNAIENINTTTIKVLQTEAMQLDKQQKGPEKEVLHYRSALMYGIEQLGNIGGISTNLLLDIQHHIEPNQQGVRALPGTVIANNAGEILYTPPAGKGVILDLLSNLENFIHQFDDGIDPLIKMAVIHYQFESIHPFYDGNGRTGRILMILYLVLTKKLDFPVLFLSEYINQTRSTYYKLLNQTSISGDYTSFIEYILQGVIEQSSKTQIKIGLIKGMMEKTQSVIKNSSSKYDYHQITQILYSYPYMTVSGFAEKLQLSKVSSIRYVAHLEEIGVIKTVKLGRNTLIYIPEFISLLS